MPPSLHAHTGGPHQTGPDRRHSPSSFAPPAEWSRLVPAPVAGHAWRGIEPTAWYVAETGSTNLDLLDAAAAGAPDRTVLVAGHQTAGRGRLDRRWEAPPGDNLLVSILFRQVPDIATQLAWRVALAGVAAARAAAAVEARIKWPNDLVVGDAKLAGLLAHRAPNGEVVVGIGLNVAWAPVGAASLAGAATPASGPPATVSATLWALLVALDELGTLDAAALAARYQAALATLGREVRVECPDVEIVGRAIGLEDDGRLIVLDRCGITHRLDVGDVIHLRT